MKTALFRSIILLGWLCSVQPIHAQYTEHAGLPVGREAPRFAATTNIGDSIKMEELLLTGPVVLVFYRGQWCPVCNRHLGNLQDSLELITGRGATVIAVSPEKPELTQKTAKKTGAAFALLFDDGYRICDAYGVTFQPDSGTRLKYNTFLAADLKNAHSDTSERLPVPATYIIERDGTIIWRHFDTDYRQRASVAEILKHI